MPKFDIGDRVKDSAYECEGNIVDNNYRYQGSLAYLYICETHGGGPGAEVIGLEDELELVKKSSGKYKNKFAQYLYDRSQRLAKRAEEVEQSGNPYIT